MKCQRLIMAAMLATPALIAGSAFGQSELPKFGDVSKDYKKVVSTADGSRSLYGLWVRDKDSQMLAELPSGWQNQKYFFALTQASGGVFAGLQGPERYVYWRRYDDRLALIQPELETRATGEQEAQSSVERLFTDRVLVDVPIVCMGPSGQPVIDMDDLLLNQASTAFGGGRSNSRLAKITKAKAFPQNVEIAIDAPGPDGRFVEMHYSISLIPNSNGYKPREADNRVGYFTTNYRDLSKYQESEKWIRYVNRWHLEKRDPSLKLSPPKEPIVYYVEHTCPVRYRRWVREGIEYWNVAFRAIGLDNAIEVHFQDKQTGTHMEKDPEDVRYNFIRWLNNDISTAIGPSRAHPLTGQILDADVVLTDGWIRAFWGWYTEQMPEMAIQSFGPETLRWLETRPNWDPRIRQSSPEQRDRILAERSFRQALGEISESHDDPVLGEHASHEDISNWLGEEHMCLASHGRAFDMAVGRLQLDMLGLLNEDAADGEEAVEMLDGIPGWFVGPLLADLVAHEVGHTLGLRHNFKASSIYTLEQINSDEIKGKKPFTGSVMDYNPVNYNMDENAIQGDYAMIAVGPYDMWAIEYGYTFDDPKDVLKRVAEPELAYLTDDDLSGSDPYARQYDFAGDTQVWAESQMKLMAHLRENLLERFVKDGDSWSNARRGYQVTLNQQSRMLSMMSNWIGGAYVHRDQKGDPNGRPPVVPVEADKQRSAIDFVITHSFNDEAFGLSQDMLQYLTVDKWSDNGAIRGSSDWPIHDSILGIQASALTQLLNPTTLRRVYDNEFRVAADDDAVTLPELLGMISKAAWTELETRPTQATTARKPLISSLRRNLQREHLERMIDMTMPGFGGGAAAKPISNLAMMTLRELKRDIDATLEAAGDKMDAYSRAHLSEASIRIEKALDAQYIYNANAMGGGGGSFILPFFSDNGG